MKGFYSLVGLMLLVRGASAEFFDDGTSKARITIRVMDEEGKAIARAHTGFGFNLPKPAGGLEYVDKSGIADRNGLFTATGRTMEHITFASLKAGYYRSEGEYTFQNAVRGRWQPWGVVVTQVLRRVVNPIPMYAKHVETKIPATNALFGFDLSMGDWVEPVGKGATSDLVFRVDGYWRDYRNNDSTLTLTFAQANDGVVCLEYGTPGGMVRGSAFRWPREAPDRGYQPDNRWRKARKAMPGLGKDEVIAGTRNGKSYLFRVRSDTNEAGVVTNAYYGKIGGDLDYGGAGTNGCYLNFTYYLNPTPNDLNLEFDPERNLFTNLKRLEDVNAP
jgi:hypothetical protein